MGGSFIGNHAHRALNARSRCTYMKFTNLMCRNQISETLCSAPVDIARKRCSALVPEAEGICDTFQTALELFASCHNIYDSTKVDSATIASLSKHTGYTVYMSTCLNCDPYYRNKHQGFYGFLTTALLTATVLPKMRMLECYIPGWRSGMLV